MTKDLKFDLVMKEILVGLGCAVVGAILGFIIVSQILGWFDLLFALFGGYIGILTGIGIVVYKFLNKNGRQKDFVKFFLQGFLGLAVGLFIAYIIAWNGLKLELPNVLVNFTAIAFPTIGTMFGFNYNLSKSTGDKEKTVDKETV
jgi:hypothetical protein